MTSDSTRLTLKRQSTSLNPTVFASSHLDTTRLALFIGISTEQDCIAKTFVRTTKKAEEVIASGKLFALANKIGKTWRTNSKTQHRVKKLRCTKHLSKISFRIFLCCSKQKKQSEDEGTLSHREYFSF